MIGKFLVNNWRFILIIILFIVIGIMTKIYVAEVVDRRRLEANVEQLTMDHKSQILRIKDEAQKRYLISQDSLVTAVTDSLNLRPAKIERIINTKYVYIHDTVFVELTPNKVDSTFKDFKHIFDPCASVTGRINWKDNLLIFDEYKNDINISTIYYWDRKHRFLWIFSKKLHFAVTTNNCTGESTFREIIFEK